MTSQVSRYQPANWLRGVVLGLDDGLVTTLVTIQALTNATTHLLVVMMGVVLASTVSMALGGYASTKLSNDAYPVLQGLEVGGAFLVGGIFPLIPVALHLSYMQAWSYLCTAIVALAFGVLKAKYTDGSRNAVTSAAFFLLIVTIGTIAGIGIGMVLQ